MEDSQGSYSDGDEIKDSNIILGNERIEFVVTVETILGWKGTLA